MFPTRYTELVNVRARHGHRADQVAAYFARGDDPADAVVDLFNRLAPNRGKRLFDRALEQGIAAVPDAPDVLRALFAQVEETPIWVNPGLLELGSRTQLRCGILWSVTLACSCLPLSYRSAAGIKPLVFSEQFIRRSVRRLSETNRFLVETCSPDGLAQRGPGWKVTLRVRLMHAQMRRLLRRGKQRPWNEAAWGVPINQVDLAATQLLFSISSLQHLRRLGFHFSPLESESVMHLWRYAGHLLGIVPELLPATETEGAVLKELLLDVAGGPDADSPKLTDALMSTAMPWLIVAALPWLVPVGDDPAAGRAHGRLARLGHGLARFLGLHGRPEATRRQLAHFCYGLSHGILGNRVAQDLHYPPTRWRYAAPALLRSFVIPLEACRRLLPGGTRVASWLGHRQMQRLLRAPLFAVAPTFRTPE
jgi:hypothetical protein